MSMKGVAKFQCSPLQDALAQNATWNNNNKKERSICVVDEALLCGPPLPIGLTVLAPGRTAKG